MKKIFCFILFLFIGINVFGHSGVLSGEDDLHVVKTKWFQIIYSEDCEKSATLLYDNADRIFEEVTEQYGLIPNFSLPVVITPAVDVVNAFFTSYPYNRIVMYDTSAHIVDELSAGFSETFLSVFRHELTHAVTFNIKNGFWTGFTKIFGDGVLPGAFFITSGMAEGAAVASESANGEGRLNNEYAKHIVKQAKIENSFPNYFDVQGSADSLITGIQYYFNGAFHQWLQQQYGMEKYTNFWYRVLNLNRVGVLWSFKKVYGISIRKAWKEFYESYEVPAIEANPLDSKNVFDFFNNYLNLSSGENEYSSSFSSQNKGGFRYFTLSSSDSGIIYSDLYSGKVFFVSKESITNNKKIKPEILFSQNGLETVTFSKDGRFITASYISNNEYNITAKIKIYDTEKKSFFYVDEKGLKNGVVVFNGDNYYLVCHKYNSPYNSILIKKINFSDKNKISDIEDVFSYELPANVFCSNFIDLGNGSFGYIKKNHIDFSICIGNIYDDNSGANIKINNIAEYRMPKGVVIHNISGSDGEIYFSWAEDGTMPRLGFTSNDNIYLSEEDISGGIFNPVAVKSDNSETFIYIGKFYKENKILAFNSESEIVKNCKVIINEPINKTYQDNYFNAKTDISMISEEYRSVDYLTSGIFLPISVYSSELLGDNIDKLASFLPFGITYGNTNPWSNGLDDLLLITAGWGPMTNSFGISATLNKGTGTELFSYELDLKTEFDMKGWKNSSGEIYLSSGFGFGRHSSFAVEDDFKIICGKYTKLDRNNQSLFEKYKSIDGYYGMNISNIMSVGYSNIHKTGPGRFEKGGLTVKSGFLFVADSKRGKVTSISSSLSINIPKLIPIIPRDNFVYNMPVKLSLSLFPVSSKFGLTGASVKTAGYGVLDANIETVLFGMDIQRAIPFFDILFIQDFYFKLGYSSTVASYTGSKKGFQIPYVFEYFSNLSNGKSLYLDSIYLNFVVDLSANVGVLANSMIQTGVYGQVSYILNDVEGFAGKWNFTFGIGARF